MLTRLLTSTAFLLALVGTAAAADLSTAERAALSSAPSTELVALRAGEAATVPVVATTERDGLTRAAAASTDLDTLRAGDVSDHTLTVIGVVAVVVIAAILIF